MTLRELGDLLLAAPKEELSMEDTQILIMLTVFNRSPDFGSLRMLASGLFGEFAFKVVKSNLRARTPKLQVDDCVCAFITIYSMGSFVKITLIVAMLHAYSERTGTTVFHMPEFAAMIPDGFPTEDAFADYWARIKSVSNNEEINYV